MCVPIIKYIPKARIYSKNRELLLASHIQKEEQILIKDTISKYIEKAYFLPKNIKQLKVKVSFSGQIADKDLLQLPSITISFNNTYDDDQIFYSTKWMSELYKLPKNGQKWGYYADEDIFNLENYKNISGFKIKIDLCNVHKIDMKIKDIKIEFLQLE